MPHRICWMPMEKEEREVCFNSAVAGKYASEWKHALITEINSQVALFRDLLIHIGTARDCPELREKIRKLRRTCVDACKHTSQLLLPQIRSAVAEGIPADHPHLVLLFFMCQLFLRELAKCSRLVQLVPMDMTGYFGTYLIFQL
ncbi:hypothetical protein J6590_041056 [Homalodisca vitripennis]|nr:hypothetical protein J6590_041056 [Homalodisca vitripennis]